LVIINLGPDVKGVTRWGSAVPGLGMAKKIARFGSGYVVERDGA
jgi:hypothetical protein